MLISSTPIPLSSRSSAPLPATSSHRLRHSSTPNSLPSTKTQQVTLSRPFCAEAEDVFVRPRLAGWEERVLRAREERKTRRQQKVDLVKAAGTAANSSVCLPIRGECSLNLEVSACQNLEVSACQNLEAVACQNLEAAACQNLEAVACQNLEAAACQNLEAAAYQNLEATACQNSSCQRSSHWTPSLLSLTPTELKSDNVETDYSQEHPERLNNNASIFCQSLQLPDAAVSAANAYYGATNAATLTSELPANGRCLACNGSCLTARSSCIAAANNVASRRRMSCNDSSLLESSMPLLQQFQSNDIQGSVIGGNCFECSRITDNCPMCSNCLIQGSKEKSKLPVINKLDCYCNKYDSSCIKVDYDNNIISEHKCDLDGRVPAATGYDIGNNEVQVVGGRCEACHQRLTNAAQNFGAEFVEQPTATKVDLEIKTASEYNSYKNRDDLSQSITNDIYQRQSTCAAAVNSKLTFNGRSGGPWRSGLPGLAQLALILTCFVTLSSAALLQNTNSVVPRVCKANININHRTKAEDLSYYHNCSVLEGSLQINSALKDYQKANDHPPFSFPHLVEITDYLLLFRANQIGNLSVILPKLAVIRGHRLVHNSALAVYQMKNMKTLGLYSLTSIMRGGVRIEKNPSLCYVNTINWKTIIMDEVVIKNDHIFIEENMDSNACLESCAGKCGRYCWDPDHCQIGKDKCSGVSSTSGLCYSDSNGDVQAPCSSQCLGGCTASNSPEHCYACRNVWYTSNNTSICVDKCPEDFLSYKAWKCISEESCMNLRYPDFDREEDEFYKIHTVDQNTKECVHQCPAHFEAVKMNKSVGSGWTCEPCDNCPRWCEGGVINSREEAQRYKHCTHIHGEIEIRVSESDISPVLENNLKDIKIIEGSFKVTRSFALVSLFFFKSLEEIQNSDDKEFSVTVMENDNLQKLFPRKVKVSSGKAFVHYNQKLCMEEINKFIENGNMAKPDMYEVSDVTNGNKAACSKEKLNFNLPYKFSRFVGFNMSDYRFNLAETCKEDLNSLIGYEIFYREITEEQFESESVSKYEGLDACGSNVWNVIDIRPTPRNSTEVPDGCSRAEWYKEPEIGELRDLKPYTPYAVYANTLMVPHLATEASGAQSDVIFFRTKSEPPEEVHRLRWTAEAESSLFISWRPPYKTHGIIDHYEVEVDLIEMDTEIMLREKNYCIKRERAPQKQKQDVKPVKKPDLVVGGRNDSTCPVCDCPEDTKKDKNVIPDRGEDHIEEQEFYSDLINKIFVIPINSQHSGLGMRKKRSINDNNDSNSKNSLVAGTSSSPKDDKYVLRRMPGMLSLTPWTNNTRLINGTKLYQTVHIIVKDTNVMIENLKHFSLYQVKVMACQKEYNNTNTGLLTKDCSSWAIEESKTRPKAGADDIIMPNDEIVIHMANETTGETFMRWKPPSDPNQMIIMYTVRTTKTLSSDESNHLSRCISLSAIEKLDNGWVQTKLTREGEFWVSLRAESMYGSGKWTKWQLAQINGEGSYGWIVLIVVLCAAGVALIAGFLGWRHYRTKGKNSGGPWIIVSPNPDYLDTGFVYQQDDWEVARELITRGEELGSGSFGVCYRGIYNHGEKGNVQVAIKSVPDHATFRQRIEFLNEASVMKDINTEYVVRLIGVVSQGQPTLVLMELMENGDLRKYLRGQRPELSPDQPTLQQTLKMALEIADGMAYLSVRKYVHRDLAARNCMVASNFVVKVGDFGMAQDVYEKEYYRTEGRRLLPVRWMAPESLRDGKFTSKSDVWSYGVVLWEMATLAEQPYQGWGNDEVVSYVKEGSIMPRPDGCPSMLYDMMRDCWQRDPTLRPSFLDLCERLLNEADEHYRSSSFYLSSQGVEALANQRAQRIPDPESSSTPLTYNGGGHTDNNGSATKNGEGGNNSTTTTTTSSQPHRRSSNNTGGPTISFRIPTDISFTGLTRSIESKTKPTSNGLGLGVIQRLRNKSGSSSGDLPS